MPGRKRSLNQRDVISSKLGIVVRERREALGITQERLAELADLSKNYIGNIERGEQELSVTALVKVAGGLGLGGADLLKQAGL